MKRILVLTACIVLSSALTAKAVDDGWIRGVCTPQGGGVNKIDAYLIASTYPGGVLNGLEGTFSLTEPGAWFSLGGTAFNWKDNTRSAVVTGLGSPQASVNFLTTFTAAEWSRTPSGSGYSTLTGSWLTFPPTPPDVDYRLTPVDPNLGDGFDQTLLATMYINNGSWVQFDGEFGFDQGGTPVTIPGGFLVPEPGTLVLLGMAGLALLAYAWRHRRS